MTFRKRFFGLLMLSIAALLLAGVYTVMAAEPQAPQVDTDIVINEVYYLGDSTQDWVELKNTGSDTIDISAWLFCAQFNYSFQTLAGLTLLDGDDLILGPGEIVTLRAWTDLNNTSSDLGLYTSTSFTSPGAMVDYVQWGTPINTGRANVAAAKGIWQETSPGQYDFAPTAGPGESLAFGGTNSGPGLLTLSSDLANGAPTQGQENMQVLVADLAVSKRAQAVTVSPGGLITYTLTVTSSGDLTNTNVVLTDTVPLSTTFVSADVSPVSGVLTWTLGDLAPSAVVERNFTVAAVDSGGTGTFILPGAVLVNDDYGVSSDQASASGPPVTVTVADLNIFIFLPIVLK